MGFIEIMKPFPDGFPRKINPYSTNKMVITETVEKSIFRDKSATFEPTEDNNKGDFGPFAEAFKHRFRVKAFKQVQVRPTYRF